MLLAIQSLKAWDKSRDLEGNKKTFAKIYSLS